MTPAVAVIPYAERMKGGLLAMSLDRLDWPLGRPERLAQGTVADLAPSDHLLSFPKTALYFGPRPRAKLSLMIVEPDSVHRKHLRLARLFHRRFHRILTKNQRFLEALPAKARRFVFGTTQIAAPAQVDTTKRAMCSLIASARRDLEGHQMRHRIVDHIRVQGLDVDVMGRGYRPFERKEDGLAPYRYSVIIENSREAGYFTEKLVDAMLCRTVPIYWGAPDIADFFDADGMMICESEGDIQRALQSLSETDYQSRDTAIAANHTRALHFADLEGRAARLLLADD